MLLDTITILWSFFLYWPQYVTKKHKLPLLQSSHCNIKGFWGKCISLGTFGTFASDMLSSCDLGSFTILFVFSTNRKQRKKLHDRLRQSLRNKRNNNTNNGAGPSLASSARGRRISNLPLKDLQLINVCCYVLVLYKSYQNLLNLYTRQSFICFLLLFL